MTAHQESAARWQVAEAIAEAEECGRRWSYRPLYRSL
jgi:hypothetical protein